ncbi:hypothetical protein DL95DRAFT_385996 [Leptodontidium sp. 2 PMI_412]|nr:hypothetical protein DL95DRAFT_385996 [Leptodontidium sp. 2 PMI_412]
MLFSVLGLRIINLVEKLWLSHREVFDAGALGSDSNTAILGKSLRRKSVRRKICKKKICRLTSGSEQCTSLFLTTSLISIPLSPSRPRL